MIIVRIWEGLGNQLFQYAYAKAMALRTKNTVLLDICETGSLKSDGSRKFRKCELKNFRISLPVCTNVSHFYPYLNCRKDVLNIIKRRWINKLLPYKYYEEPDPKYHEELLKMRGNWYLQGWFQDARYFKDYEDVIRKELVTKKEIKISERLNSLLKNENTVSVHIRRGDYKKIANTLPVNYYYNAMNYIKKIAENPFWIVFSDDAGWCKKNIEFGDNVYFVSNEENIQDYEELIVMSRCKNQIIANSTFSWWGAWLNSNNDKIVIGPRNWFRSGSKNAKYNIMCSEWIKM